MAVHCHVVPCLLSFLFSFVHVTAMASHGLLLKPHLGRVWYDFVHSKWVNGIWYPLSELKYDETFTTTTNLLYERHFHKLTFPKLVRLFELAPFSFVFSNQCFRCMQIINGTPLLFLKWKVVEARFPKGRNNFYTNLFLSICQPSQVFSPFFQEYV